MKLTPKIIDATPTPAQGRMRLWDGDGLYLQLPGRYWRLKYRLAGKEQTFSIGVYPAVTVDAARAAARGARLLVKRQISPTAAAKAARSAAYVAKARTLGTVGREFLDKKLSDTKLSPTTKKKFEWLFGCLEPLYDRPIGEVRPGEVITLLERVQAGGHLEAGHRIAQFVRRVFNFAMVKEYVSSNPVPDLREILQPRRNKPMAAYTDPQQFGQLMAWIDGGAGRHPSVEHGLQLIARTALRPGELRRALWAEIDVDKAEWRVPATRMKMRREHLVPLSRQAIEILKRHRTMTDGPLVFPGVRSGRPMSDAAMNRALEDMMIPSFEHTVHGFRSSFSTIMNEHGHDSALIELQLSHRKRDRIAGIYDRSERVPERRKLMQAWADLIDQLKKKTG